MISAAGVDHIKCTCSSSLQPHYINPTLICMQYSLRTKQARWKYSYYYCHCTRSNTIIIYLMYLFIWALALLGVLYILSAHRDRIYAVARDVGNPSPQDPYFPVVRHQDIYNGFSWASGVVPGERQEESSSEGINCYHALAALGEAFQDPWLKHTGQLHLAMEIASVREYWQVRAHNRQHFPPMLQQFGVVGMIAEGAWYLYTLNWPCDPNRFPMRHGCLVGIQVIPITAVSRYWMDQEWAGSIKNTCEMAINPQLAPDYSRVDHSDPDFRELTSGWQAFCYAAMAPLDNAHKTSAANYLRDKRPQQLVGGTGAASTLLFIYGST